MKLDAKPCSFCHQQETYRPTLPRGLWERAAVALVGMKPFRCRSCGRRILHREAAAETQRERRSGPPASIPSQDSEDFDKLIQEIRQAEARMNFEDRER